MITFGIVLVVLIFINLVLIALSTYKVESSPRQKTPDTIDHELSKVYRERFGSTKQGILESTGATRSQESNPANGKEPNMVPTKQKESKSVRL